MKTKFKIGETDYSLSFYPSLTTAQRVAEQFCRQKGGEFGVTEATLPACINSIASHVANVVAQGTASAAPAPAKGLPVEKEYRSITVSGRTDRLIDITDCLLYTHPSVRDQFLTLQFSTLPTGGPDDRGPGVPP